MPLFLCRKNGESMRVSRLYVPDSLQLNQQYELPIESAHYVRTVLRLKKGHALNLFNGQGKEYPSELLEVSRKAVLLIVKQELSKTVESPLKVILGLGISRGDRMDWAVQKAVELGANQITPLMTERCVVKLKADKRLQKQQHWKNIVQHATEQCLRTELPEFNAVEGISDWLPEQKGLKVFLDPYAERSLTDLRPEDMKVTLLSGPEGGFSNIEREQAIAAGFIPVRLGARVLRTETAALAALSAVQMLWGDFG